MQMIQLILELGLFAIALTAPPRSPAAVPVPPSLTPMVDPLPFPACVDGVIILLAARYSGSGLPQTNCTIRGQPGSVIVGPNQFSTELRIEGTLQFDAAGQNLNILELYVRGSVTFTNYNSSRDSDNGDWYFEQSRVVFQNCSVNKMDYSFAQISNSTVILIDSTVNAATVVFESSQLNMTRAGLHSTSNIRINDTTMSLISSYISAGWRNRQISIANSVMSLHNSSLMYGGDTIVIPLQFVNTTATFTGSRVPGGSINIDAYVSSGFDVPAVSFVDSWVSFPHCSSLDQVINVADGNISIKGGRVWCVSNTAMTAEDNAQIATVVV